ncbi:sensor histidine kinase, partial [Clostridium sp.]|uniref:sensor histidine kinase n=1 Tax=Clostridium sp. TaxID=1506 RepID=UPI0034646D70
EKVKISVKDTGVGISEENQKIIFNRFAQVPNCGLFSKKGSGIGLTLVKSLVELHHGTIEVKSEVNRGSEFIITLPCKQD